MVFAGECEKPAGRLCESDHRRVRKVYMNSILDFCPEGKSQTPESTGWQPVKVVDLYLDKTKPNTCDRCGRSLRFLHTVAHPEKGRLQVGSECARHLCRGYAPEREERRLRNLWSRRSRWLTRRWRTSRAGNETLRFLDGAGVIQVTVFPRLSGGWSYCVALSGEPPHGPTGTYATADEAKLAAFNVLHGDRLIEGGW
jgi:hypothetical protein